MSQRYKSLDELWSEWGSATTAIMNHIRCNEPLGSRAGWSFDEGLVVNHHNDGYSVTIIHTAYDPNIGDSVLLSVQAKVGDSGEVNVATVKREPIEQ